MAVTLLDILTANNGDREVGLIDEASQANPEWTLGSAKAIPGTHYKTLVRTALPAAAFRSANEGTTAVKGTYENRLIETFILDMQWQADKAVADQYVEGPEAYCAMEASGIVEAAVKHASKIFYYGQDATFGDTKGFPGLLSAYDSTNMVVDAGGTTASVCSSCWGVKFGRKDVQWVVGNEGSMDAMDPQIIQALDSNSKPYAAYWQYLLAHLGLQVGNQNCIGRIKKLSTDSGKGLTDDLISDLLATFPVGSRPDVLLMNRRSNQQLQDSRTATNSTGAPAPFPTESFGVPIVVTDSIVSTESTTL